MHDILDILGFLDILGIFDIFGMLDFLDILGVFLHPHPQVESVDSLWIPDPKKVGQVSQHFP